MPWRRKPDGRPYADVMRDGIRYRESLLTREMIDAGPPWPDDATCARMYDLWLRLRLPELRAGARVLPETDPTLVTLLGWYCTVVMPARGNEAETQARNEKRIGVLLDFLAGQGVRRVSHLEQRPGVIDEMVAWRMRTVNARTARMELTVLRAILRAAVSRRIIDRDPVIEWPSPRARDIERQEPLTGEQLALVLEALDTAGVSGRPAAAAAAVRLCAYTGFRPSDVRGLRKDRLIDLDGPQPRALIVQQKTKKLVSVALSPPAVEAIREGLETSHGPYVFHGRLGGRLHINTMAHALRLASKRALGFEISPRRLRESVVSLLAEQGVPLEQIALLTGHQSRAIYAYLRVRSGAVHDVAARYADLLERR